MGVNMRDIQALIFDDVDEDLKEIIRNLKSNWDKYRFENGEPLPPINIKGYSSATEMANLLVPQQGISNFHLFLSDLMIGEVGLDDKTANGGDPELGGFRFLRDAKELGVLVCVSISHGQYKHKRFETISREFAQWVDLSFLKSDLYGSVYAQSRQAVISDLVEQLQIKGALKTLQSQLVMDGTIQESRTLGILNEIGQKTMDSFASRFALPGSIRYTVRALAPGLSGSKVLFVEYEGHQENLANRPLVIKLCRDPEPLNRELDAYTLHIHSQRRTLIPAIAAPTFEKTIEINGWHGLAFPCIPDAKTLLDWLTDKEPPFPEQIAQAFEELYRDNGLIDLYSDTKKIDCEVVERITNDLLSDYRKMAIFEAIEELRPLIEMFWSGSVWRRDLIEGFLYNGIVGTSISAGKLRWETSTAICHGDFHGRNVLVQTSVHRPKLRIIDLASMRRYFWATDAVRLVVDLALSGWDHGPRSYDWANINTWNEMLDLLLGTELGATASSIPPANRSLQFALSWLHDNCFANHAVAQSDRLKGEYLLALAVELMRAAYRKLDLPAPKRAFALIAAAKAIEEAEKKFAKPPK